jgi:hypothetical protein
MSHSLQPGVAVLECMPQTGSFAKAGELIITDDVSTISIPDCKIDRLRQTYDPSRGYVWVLDILDFRWKWNGLGSISGAYNQLDQHGKLIPWTIRSPYELAKLCIDQILGSPSKIAKYEIDMPDGLSRADGEKHLTLNPIWLGVIPTTGTNPPINWVAEPPIIALEHLCNKFGRRVVVRLSDNAITIVKPGFGADLPPGSIANHTPGLDDPETPAGVAVVGDPTRFQVRLRLEAVAEEWDGHYVPIDEVSYAPVSPERTQQTKIRMGSPVAGDIAYVYVNGFTFSYEIAGGDSRTTVLTALADAINAGEDAVAGNLTATVDNPYLVITGASNDYDFTVRAEIDGETMWQIRSHFPASTGLKSWQRTSPPTYFDLGDQSRYDPDDFSADDFNIVTERLSFSQALDLAQRSVFRTYRVCDVDVTTTVGRASDAVLFNNNKTPIFIPGYGKLKRRQQIILQPTKVEQIKPEQQLLETVDLNGLPAIVNFYNGYSRDKPAAVYGSVSRYLNFDLHHIITGQKAGDVGQNTDYTDQVHIPFSIDPENQLVVFSSPVFMTVGNRIIAPNLVLETGVLIRDAETNEIVRHRSERASKSSPNKTDFLVRHHPDVQKNVLASYDENSILIKTELLELDAINRAEHYLTGMEIQFFQTSSEIREYNGFMAINLDGAIRQVTWTFGERGCTTMAGRNTEHSIYVPPYPARRREELLPSVLLENNEAADHRLRGEIANINDRPNKPWKNR